MAVKLRDPQIEALNQLHSGCILAGGVGTGKSLVSIAWYLKQCKTRKGYSDSGETLMPLKGSPDLLIITEAIKRDRAEWGDELVKYGLHEGVNKPSGIEITVQSWQMIKHFESFKGVIIFDEQHVSGSGSWVKSFYKMTKMAPQNKWILLSATPADTYEDLIPIFVANGFYKNKTQFMQLHAVYDRWSKFPKVKEWIRKDRLEYLRRKIMVPMDRPRNEDGSQAGPKRAPATIKPVQFDKLAEKHLRKERKDPWTGEPLENISQFCAALRKLVNSDPSRLETTFQICVEHPRVIIFYNYDYELEELRTLGERLGRKIFERNGHKHDDLPEDKNGEWVYLVNYASGAAAWNCITTDTVIFYSLNYSYKIMEQAAGRIDRLNSPYKMLNYYVLRSYSSLDTAILRALKLKGKFNERDFGRKNGWS